jgi:dihydroorotase
MSEGSSPLLITGGRVVDPASGIDEVLDLLLQDGVVARLAEHIPPPKGAEVVNAAGLVVAPGFVDLHTHLREPGYEYKETIASGTAAAAAGGFTTVCCMANTDPVLDDAPTVAFVVRRAGETAHVRVHPLGAVTKGLKGIELAEIGSMKAEGAVAISDDGKPIANGNVMRRALEYASMLELPVVVHEEDPTLVAGGVMNEGWTATRLGLAGWPNVAESSMVARDLQLAALTKARLHIAHLSARESVEQLRRARRAGVRVTAEVTPHHLTLTDEEVARSGYDTRFKMNPPLRTEADRAALVDALADGTLDAIATDHAPHHRDEKLLEFADAPFGVTGLETALPVLLDALVQKKKLTLGRLVEALTIGPARCFNLPYGTLKEGAPADAVLFSTSRTTAVSVEGFLSRSANSPWLGRTLHGRVERTIVAGREVYRGGTLLGRR